MSHVFCLLQFLAKPCLERYSSLVNRIAEEAHVYQRDEEGSWNRGRVNTKVKDVLCILYEDPDQTLSNRVDP
jgi:hypothetical protein